MSRNLRIYLLALAFVSGACVMTIEMAGQRALAPHFGSSYYIWTNVIAIILAALSLGYYFGGKIADRAPKPAVLLGIVAAAGLFSLGMPWLVSVLGDILVPEGTGFEFSFRIIFLGGCTRHRGQPE